MHIYPSESRSMSANMAHSCYGCGPNSCSISLAISMLFCEIWRARIAKIWSNPSPTSCSSWRSVSTPHRAEFSLLASWLSRSLRCGGGDDDTFTGWQLLVLLLVAVVMGEDLSSECSAVEGFTLITYHQTQVMLTRIIAYHSLRA